VKQLKAIVVALVLVTSCGHQEDGRVGRVDKSITTQVRESTFSATLPGTWTREPGPEQGLTSFTDASALRRLTVSAYASRMRSLSQTASDSLQQFLEIVRSVDTQAPGDGVAIEAAVLVTVAGHEAAYYYGSGPDRSRRFFTLIVCTGQSVTHFTYEALDVSEAVLREEVDVFMKSLETH